MKQEQVILEPNIEADMKKCPRCGKKFNILQRATGEAEDHLLRCTHPEEKKDLAYLAATCRGCPARCYERMEYDGKE